MKYLQTESNNPYYNLAFEEYVLENLKDDDYLILWQNDNAIVVGQNQNTLEEINRSFVEEHNIDVVRRATGGGAVYHDMGNLNYSFITDVEDLTKLSIEIFCRPVVEALRELGVDASASGRNDILIGDKKVSGTAQRIVDNRILHHGTLLFDSNMNMIAGALNADPEKFKSKSTKSVRSRVGSIKSALSDAGREMTITEFWKYLVEFFSGKGSDEVLVPTQIDDEAIEKIKEIQKNKYENQEWNYGKSPDFTYHNKRHFKGGTLEVYLNVSRGGIINDIKFFGDFMSRKSLTEIERELKDSPYMILSTITILSSYYLPDYFGEISIDEIVSLVFGT